MVGVGCSVGKLNFRLRHHRSLGFGSLDSMPVGDIVIINPLIVTSNKKGVTDSDAFLFSGLNTERCLQRNNIKDQLIEQLPNSRLNVPHFRIL